MNRAIDLNGIIGQMSGPSIAAMITNAGIAKLERTFLNIYAVRRLSRSFSASMLFVWL